MHPYIREGLENIADEEKKSVSWVIAEIVGDYLGVDAATGEVRSITRYTRSLLSKKGKKNVLTMPTQGAVKKVRAR